MTRIEATLAFLAVAALPAVAHAHPGHGTTPGQTVLHLVAEPLHLLSLLGTIVLVAGLVWRARAR